MNGTRPAARLPFVLLLTASMVLVACERTFDCLSSGSADSIIESLAQTGTAELCQGAVFTARHPIVMADGNRVFTTGYPTSSAAKALISVADDPLYTLPMIQAYTAVGAEVRNVRLDGRRGVTGHERTRALIAMGGTNGVIDRVDATNTGGLSAIAAADDPDCTGLRLTNNFVANNGLHDSGWANGIDIRCSNALVSGNHVVDATDGGISFYGGSNTIIEHNRVENRGRSAYSGIIAASLFAGDFTGSLIRDNLVETCCGQHTHVALAVGTHLWCHDEQPSGECDRGTNARVERNSATGTFGFGIVVEGMDNAIVLDNTVTRTEWPLQACLDVRNGIVVGREHAANAVVQTQTSEPGGGDQYDERLMHWPCLVAVTANSDASGRTSGLHRGDEYVRRSPLTRDVGTLSADGTGTRFPPAYERWYKR